MPDPTDEPLIYTSKGNLPERNLQHFVQWDRTPEYIKFTEVYKDATGEVVKESAHVLQLAGQSLGAEQAAL